MKRVLEYKGFKLELIDDGQEFYESYDEPVRDFAGYISSDILGYQRQRVFDDEVMEEYALLRLVKYVDKVCDNMVVNFEEFTED